MLRWCLPTVREAGGVFRWSSSTALRCALHHHELTSEARDDSSRIVSVSTRTVAATHGGGSDNAANPIWGSTSSSHKTAQGSSANVHTCSEGSLPSPTAVVALTPNTSRKQSSQAQLRAFLSPANLNSSTPQKYTPNALRALYTSVRTRNLSGRLSADDMSALIAIFGSLSLGGKQYRGMYGHPGIEMVLDPGGVHMKDGQNTEEGGESNNAEVGEANRECRTWWPFVAKVAGDKQSVGRSLSDGDHYWLLRAQIAEFQTLKSKSDDGSPRRRSRALEIARVQYRHLHRRSAHPDIHVPYLQMLLAQPTLEQITEGIQRLCALLSSGSSVPPQYLTMLWQFVLRPKAEIPFSLKEKIIHSLSRRARAEPSMNEEEADVQSESQAHDSAHDPRFMRLQELARALAQRIQSAHARSSSLSDQQLYAWATSTLQSAFTKEKTADSVQTAWSNTSLLAIICDSPENTSGIHPSVEIHKGNIDLRTVCVLSTLEKLINSSRDRTASQLPDDLSARISPIARTLWDQWSSHSVERPPLVAAAITASFFHLAGRIKDRRLLVACHKYVLSSSLLAADDTPTSKLGVRSFAVEYAACAAACWSGMEDVLATVKEWTRETHECSIVVNKLLRRISKTDAHLGYQTHILAQQAGIDIVPGTIAIMGAALAQQGYVELALSYLSHPKLSRRQRTEVLSVLLKTLLQRDSLSLHPTLVHNMIDAMLYLFSAFPPATSFRRSLEYALVALCSSGHPSRALSVVETIVSCRPAYFRSSFFDMFIKALLDSRNFRLANRVFKRVQALRPRHASNLQPLLVARYSRGGASALAMKMMQRMKDKRAKYPTLILARAVRFREARPERVLTLQLPALLERFKTRFHRNIGTRFALHLLVSAGRLRAAKQLYARVREQSDPASQTSMGNDIVHASMLHRSRRNKRQMRKVLDTLKQLQDEQDFQPDRVTVNILLKAYLRWTTGVDSNAVRALFDRMIQGGYPCPPDYVPFDTGTAANSSAQGVPVNFPKLTSSLSFKRHVRPLYRMFIKAFYLRGDVGAAEKVVGVLKALGRQKLVEQRKRDRARMLGRRKKRDNAARNLSI